MSTARDTAGELLELIDRLVVGLPHPWPAGSVRAVAWATVDRDRALPEIAARWPSLPAFTPLPDDVLLGASALGTTGPAVGEIRLVLVEPNTEGRMAASLARRGEGPVAVWVAAPPPAGTRLSSPGEGPFGRERLVLGGALDGPHVLLLDGAAGTIER